MKNYFKKSIGLLTAMALTAGALPLQALDYSIYETVLGETPQVPINDNTPINGNTQNQNPTSELSEANLNQAKTEAEELARLEKADFDACEAEAEGGGGSGQGPGSTGGPGGTPGNGSKPGSGGTLGANEQQTRDVLAENGINTNNGERSCGDMTYQAYRAKYGVGCTSVAGLPQESIDYLAEMNREIPGGTLTLTGGTELGHNSHGPDKNVFDISPNRDPGIHDYVRNHAVGPSAQMANGHTYFNLDTDWQAVLEDAGTPNEHYHFRKPPSGSSVAAKPKFFTRLWRSVSQLFGQTVKAENSNSYVDFGNGPVNVLSISDRRLGDEVNGMSATQINSVLPNLPRETLVNVSSRLPFDSINHVFSNLNSTSANVFARQLGGGNLSQIAVDFTYESADNFFSRLSSHGWENAVSGMSNVSLDFAFQSLSSSGIDNFLMRAESGLLNQVIGDLGGGGITTILAEGTGSMFESAFSALGTNELNFVFENIGRQTAGRLVGSVSGDFLNDIMPDLGNGALNNFMGNLGGGALESVMASITTGGDLDYFFEHIGRDAAGQLVGELGADFLNEIIPELGSGAMSNLFGNLGVDSLNGLVNGITSGNWDRVLGTIGGSAMDNVLGAIGGQMDKILPNIGGQAMTQILGVGDGSLVNAVLSGQPEQIVTKALSKVATPMLQSVANKIPIVGQFLGGGGILGGIGQAVLGVIPGLGLYVPVVEQNGQLMTHTSNIDTATANIDTTTVEIKDLSVQICTHLRAIRRIQTRMETMTADEANANRTRLEGVSKYVDDVMGKENEDSMLNKGYVTFADGEYQESQVFPANYGDYLDYHAEEATNILVDDIKQSNNLFADKMIELINEPWGTLNSSLTEEDYNMLEKAGKNSSIYGASNPQEGALSVVKNKLLAFVPTFISRPLSRLAFWKSASADTPPAKTDDRPSAEEFWRLFLASSDPENNIYGAAMIAISEKNSRIAEAEEEARDQYIASQGILPTGRKCEWPDGSSALTKDGTACRHWQVTAGSGAPGIMVRDTLARALDSKLASYLAGGPENQPAGAEPNVNDASGAETPSSATQAAGHNTGGDSQIPNLDPSKVEQIIQQIQNNNNGAPDGGGYGKIEDNTPGGGTEPGDGNTDTPINWNDLVGRLDNLWQNGGDGETQSDIDELLALAGSLFASQKPLIFAKVISPKIADIAAGRKTNEVKIVWATPNSDCVTANDWLTRSSDGKTSVLKSSGADIGQSGNIAVKLPLEIETNLEIKTESAIETVEPKLALSADLTIRLATFDLSGAPSGANLTLMLDGETISLTASEPADTISRLETAAASETFKKFNFVFDPENGKFTVGRTKPDYRLICENKNGETAKTLTIER